MNITKLELIQISDKERFKPHTLEKVWTLLTVLERIQEDKDLKGKFALKGGTALNVFYSDFPRLSVDIDLNYIGSHQREVMAEERPKLERALERVYQSMGMEIRRSPRAHAGGKYEIRYNSLLNAGKGTIEVDLSYMYRAPLFPVEMRESAALGGRRTQAIPLVSYEEVVAGKLSALLGRDASRDLFDAYQILCTGKDVDKSKLKTAFLAYYVMEAENPVEIPVEKISFSRQDVVNRLRPVLRNDEGMNSDKLCMQWAEKAVKGVQKELQDLLVLKKEEKTFLEQALKHGKTDFSLITQDESLISRLEQHPKIQWMKQKKSQQGKGMRM